MFANFTSIAEPRRIFSGRRQRAFHIGWRLTVIVAVLCVVGYALLNTLGA